MTVKEKEQKYVILLLTISILEFILSNARICSSYKKINYCRIWNNII